MPDAGRWEPVKRFVKFPIERVHIELTNRCNFQCAFCPSTKMSRPRGSMDKELAKKLIREIATEKIAEKVVFHIMGEPTLYKHLGEILDYARTLGLTTTLSTNGSLLTESMADTLIDCGLAKINVSLQTPDASSWKLRGFQSMTFEEYQDRIIKFAARVVERRSSMEVRVLLLVTGIRWWGKPFSGGMKIKVVDTDSDLRTLLSQWTNKLYDLAESSGDTRYSREKSIEAIKSVNAGAWHILHIHPNFALETYLLESWGNAMSESPIHNARYGYCSGLSDHFGVLCDGRAVFCCRDFDGKTAWGDANKESLVNLLNSPEALRAVRGFTRFRLVHPYCRRCLGSSSWAGWAMKQVGTIFLVNLLRDRFYKEINLYE